MTNTMLSMTISIQQLKSNSSKQQLKLMYNRNFQNIQHHTKPSTEAEIRQFNFSQIHFKLAFVASIIQAYSKLITRWWGPVHQKPIIFDKSICETQVTLWYIRSENNYINKMNCYLIDKSFTPKRELE